MAAVVQHDACHLGPLRDRQPRRQNPAFPFRASARYVAFGSRLGVGGFVIASLLWPHDRVWQILFLCGGFAMAYFDKRALFRTT
jgi:hypothetical protein